MQANLIDPRAPRATPDAPVGLRARQKLARREALVDAAHRLVMARGLDGVTVEEICAEAGVSTRTFFNYFASKDDAVLGVVPHVVDEAAASAFAAGGPTGDLGTDLERLVTALVAGAPFSSGRMACAVELARHEPRLLARHMASFERHHTAVAALLAARLALPTTAPRVELLTSLVMSLTRAAHLHWEAQDGRGAVADAVGAVLAELRTVLLEPADHRPASSTRTPSPAPTEGRA